MTDIADLSAIGARRRNPGQDRSRRSRRSTPRSRASRNDASSTPSWPCAPIARGTRPRPPKRQSRRGAPLGPLHGIPFSVKDLTNTEGVATTQGSRSVRESLFRPQTLSPVARARAAGAILIGKTTTPEFGHKPFTEGPFFGRTLNPWNTDHTCGGSSRRRGGRGGSRHWADRAWLGRRRLDPHPAACCGVVGLKATLGAIPNLQPPDLFGANSYVGPMARDVADTRLQFDVLVGPDRRDPYGQAAVVPAASARLRASGLASRFSCAAATSLILRSKHPSSVGDAKRPKSSA